MAISKNIVIVGGGPTGLALATALLRNRAYHITLIEKEAYAGQVVGEHLQSAVIPLLERLKFPMEILFRNATRCDGIAGEWGGRPIASSGIYNAYGNDLLLHRPEFEKAWSGYLQQKGVAFHLDSLPHIDTNSKTVSDGKKGSIKYDYLFDCSGRTSRFHYGSRLMFDKMIGVTFLSEGKLKGTAAIIIESAADGWWYHSQNKYRAITTYFTDHDLYVKDAAHTCQLLAATMIVSKLSVITNRKPVVRQCQTSVLKTAPEQIFQLGDAFYSLDPLSSQGIFKAMKQALNVSELLNEGFSAHAVAGYYHSLRLEFFETLKMRQHLYSQAHQYHQTPFYKRRILS